MICSDVRSAHALNNGCLRGDFVARATSRPIPATNADLLTLKLVGSRSFDQVRFTRACAARSLWVSLQHNGSPIFRFVEPRWNPETRRASESWPVCDVNIL